MQVGDLVWSISFTNEKRLAIITEVDHQYVNPYVIQLVASGFEGRTCKRFLEPMEAV